MTPEPEWVDLGLPSGLRWCKCNLGANRETDSGLYFSWGNIEGHQENSGYNFNSETYLETPGSTVSSDLPLANDAAHSMLGNNFRIPTKADFEELINNCSHEWVTINGVRGVQFTSNENNKTLFIPAAGDYQGTELRNKDSAAFCWTSSWDSDYYNDAFTLIATSSRTEANNRMARANGVSIRPVFDIN